MNWIYRFLIISGLIVAFYLTLENTPESLKNELLPERNPPHTTEPTPTAVPATAGQATSQPHQDSAKDGHLDKSNATVVRGDEREKLIFDLARWTVTYDQAALGKVRKYAFSADPEVRSAAVDAIVAIGMSEGADILEEAIKSMSEPEEVVETKKKINFLRLPPLQP